MSTPKGMVGPVVATVDRVVELANAGRSVYAFGRPMPAAVAQNWNARHLVNLLARGAVREYWPATVTEHGQPRRPNLAPPPWLDSLEVARVIRYRGEASAVREQLSRSLADGRFSWRPDVVIELSTIGPVIVEGLSANVAGNFRPWYASPPDTVSRVNRGDAADAERFRRILTRAGAASGDVADTVRLAIDTGLLDEPVSALVAMVAPCDSNPTKP